MATSKFSKRALSWLIDMHISMLALVLAYIGSQAAYDTWSGTTAFWVSVVLYTLWYAVGFVNRCIWMGRSGHSFGRWLMNMNLVSTKTGKPIGVPMAFVRENSHFIDWGTAGLGFLRPIWDRDRQTIADKVVHTVTVEGPVPNRPYEPLPPSPAPATTAVDGATPGAAVAPA